MAATKEAALPPPGTSLLEDNSSKKTQWIVFSRETPTFQFLTVLMLKSEHLSFVL